MSTPKFENLKDQTQSPAGHIVQPFAEGKYKRIIKAMIGPDEYETGGVTLSAVDCQMNFFIDVHISPALSGDYLAHVIYPSNKRINKTIKILITDLAGTEVADTTDLSAELFRLSALCSQ